MNRYTHTQIGWVTLGILGTSSALVVWLALEVDAWPTWLAVGLVVAAAAMFATLTIRIDDAHVTASFGPGLIRRRLALDQVAAFGAVTNSPLWGWGIRLVPGGWMWNVSGLRAVELRTRDGRAWRLGTDEPDALCRALERALPDAKSLDEVEATHSSAWLGAVMLAIPVSIAGAIGIVFAFNAQAPDVRLSETHLVVDGWPYSAEVARQDIVSVTLRDELPRITLRTNGYADGRRLRGWFRVEGRGQGQVFVDRRRPPFLDVVTRDGFLVVQGADAESTRDLADALR